VPGRRLIAPLLASVPKQLVDLRRHGPWARLRYELDRVQRASPDLDLLSGSMLNQLFPDNALEELGLEVQDPVEPQHVWDEIVGEHRQSG
jgi:hypothetical protein